MKYILIAVLANLIAGTAAAQLFPLKADSVLNAFYKNYSIGNLSSSLVQFEKRNQSWYVYTLDPDSGMSVHLNSQLFYNAIVGRYEAVSFTKRYADTTVDANTLLYGDLYNFDVQPSYGYPGWYNDVIKEYSRRDTLSIDETYSLARAYSSAAAARLSTQFGNVPLAEVFTTALRTNCLTEAQVNAYLSLENKAIALFEKVAAHNPDFSTLVGSISRKAANEKVVAYHNLMVYAGNFLYKAQLPDDLYEKDLLDSIKNILSACPPNSVFLSFGDNDFYPFLFLQAKGFRQDVHLINASLLGLDRYIFYSTTQTWFKAKPIASSFDTTDYRNESNAYRLLDSGKQLPMSSIVAAIKKLPQNRSLPSNRWVINGKKINGVPWKNPVFIASPYVTKETMILMDALNRLNGRKFCMLSLFSDQLKNLNPFFHQKGNLLVYDN